MSTISQEYFPTDPNEFCLDDLTLRIPKKFSNAQQNSGKKNLTDRLVLIEKKKHYSEAIRERNLNLTVSINLHDNTTKKKNDASKGKGRTPRETYQYENERECCMHKHQTYREKSMKSDRKQNFDGGVEYHKPHISSRKEKLINQSCRLNIKPNDLCNEYFEQNKTPNALQWSQGLSKSKNGKTRKHISPFKLQTQFTQTQQFPKKVGGMQIVSKVASFSYYTKDEQKQTLKKQNETFKRDLAHFRKQTGFLQKELQKSKKLLEQFQQTFNEIAGQLSEGRCPLNNPHHSHSSMTQGDSLETLKHKIEILEKQRAENKIVKVLNEKKLQEQVSSMKKKMGKEIALWQQKYQRMLDEKQKYQQMREIVLTHQMSDR